MVMRNNKQVMPFLSATAARNGTRELIANTTREDLYEAGKKVNRAIQDAMGKRLTTVTIHLSVAFSDSIVRAMKRTFQKKGYLVRITSTGGLFERGLVWQPRTYITLSWF